MSLPPTERFSDRVENYVRYRPSYPTEVLDLLSRECGLGLASSVADVGSGTGIFARLLAERVGRVFAVEPNAEMRAAASGEFVQLAGTAEATGLEDGSVDAVTCAQSFHWFDPPAARKEFRRILKPGGWVALLWNQRLSGAALMSEYDALLFHRCPGYAEAFHRDITGTDLSPFFSEMREARFEHFQELDEEAFVGRVLSSSYTPAAGSAEHAPFVQELRALFARHENRGFVRFPYETFVYYGTLD